MNILVDEMYPATVAEALIAAGIEATTVADLRLAGASDPEVFGGALAGGHHHGLLIALSSRFHRRPAGLQPLIAAIEAVADERIDDRVVYLERAKPR